MSLRTHRDLEAWKKAMDFAEMVFQATKKFPREEVYGK
ncbi:MAG: four helix bundle protein [Victivallaceae bacterium]|nr:four helix bundle protein [Victivallaceae bacterium]